MSFALLEDRRPGALSHYYHGKAKSVICRDALQLPGCLEEIECLRQAGAALVGFISYEMAYALDPSILSKPISTNIPLLHFMTFEHHDLIESKEVGALLEQLQPKPGLTPLLSQLKLDMDWETYERKLAQIKHYLREGETYQVNFTTHYHFDYQGNSIALYQQLRERQKVAYSALFHCDDYDIVSLSPELFFEKRGDTITAKPMKGTAPRTGNKTQDAQAIDWLTTDPKTLAENVIIVDLTRNDLSMIARPGSVNVPKLFEVESYSTVHQMTSTVEAGLPENISFVELLKAIFPCGSITGAPKKRTLQIIHELEQEPRGVYTGAIGYINPNNDMCFNVAIRTIMLQNGRGRLGVGGGIVYDSDAREEYEEIQLKARFLTQLDPGFELIECLLYHSECDFRYLREHLDRLAHSAKSFSFICPRAAIEQSLQRKAHELLRDRPYKIKITLQKNGHFTIDCQVVSLPDQPVKIGLHSHPVIQSQDQLWRHKTTSSATRGQYDKLLMQAQSQGLYDVLVCNERGEVCEGCKTNVLIQREGRLYTPALACGLLPGILRARLLAELPVMEASITIQDIQSAQAIWVFNSVVGKLQAELCL